MKNIKLTVDQLYEIRKLESLGMTRDEIANLYGVRQRVIRSVCRRFKDMVRKYKTESEFTSKNEKSSTYKIRT